MFFGFGKRKQHQSQKCLRCGHTWTPYVKKPKQCPECRSRYWRIPYIRGKRVKKV